MADYTLIDHTDDVMNAMGDALERAMTAVGLHLVSEAQDELENTPRRIDTGRLRASIDKQYVPTEKAVYVGTNVEYAPYVHEGTVNMTPNRFIKNAVIKNKDQIQEYFKNNLKN